MKDTIKKWVIFWVTAILTMIIAWLAYAWIVWTVSTWETLTATMWNDMAWNYNYSTGEVITGKKWVDWKPIYRKVIDVWSVTGNKSVSHNISDLDTVISTDVSYIQSGYWHSWAASYKDGSSWYQRVKVSLTVVRIYLWSSDANLTEYYAILHYTKTTD